MSISELAGLARRHVAAVFLVFLVALGIGYGFKHTNPGYTETATVTLATTNPHNSSYIGSLVTTCQVMVAWISGPEGQHSLQQADVGSGFAVALVNDSNADDPQYNEPYLTVSATGQDAAATHREFLDGMAVLEERVATVQASARMPAQMRITAQILEDSGPQAQLGSRARTYGALAFLTLVALYLVTRFLDSGSVVLRRRMRQIVAGRQPSRYPLQLAKRVLRPRRLAVLELRNKLLLWPPAVALRRFENREVARLSTMLTLPEAQVAVVVTTYRRPESLVDAIRSVLAQSVEDLVVIVVDDGGGMLPQLPPDRRLAVCALSANTGVPGVARNVGIRLTKSPYVAFLDDDNEWEARHLETALQVLEQKTGEPAGFVYTALRRCLPDGRTHDVLSVEFDRGKLGFDNFVDTNAMVIRRFPALRWSRIPRSRGVLPGEDWELAYRLSRTVRAAHVSSPTVRYRMNPGSHFTDWVAAR